MPVSVPADPDLGSMPVPVPADPDLGSMPVSVPADPDLGSVPVSADPDLSSMPVSVPADPDLGSVPVSVPADPDLGSVPVSVSADPDLGSVPVSVSSAPTLGSVPVSEDPDLGSAPVSVPADPDLGSVSVSADPDLGSVPVSASSAPTLGSVPVSDPADADLDSMSVTTPDWSSLPEVALAAVFCQLPVPDRLSVGRACRTWHAACASPQVWRHFHYGEDVGQNVLHEDKQDHVHKYCLRAQHALYMGAVERYGHWFKCISIILHDAQSLAILQALTRHCHTNLHCCTLQGLSIERLSPDCSNAVRHFLTTHTGVKTLRLHHLLLNGEERNTPLPLGFPHSSTLQHLSLINCFHDNNLAALTYLVKLQELSVMPHQLRFTWLQHLVSAGSLRALHMVSMAEGRKGEGPHVTENDWRQVAQCGKLAVHCYLLDMCHYSRLLLLHTLPLATLACRQVPGLRVPRMERVLSQYTLTLTTFISCGSQDDCIQPGTGDDHILRIVQTCPRLQILAVEERLHSSTLLLAVQLCPSLRQLLVRQDRLLYGLHLPPGLSVTNHMASFTSQHWDRDCFLDAMSVLLRQQWQPLDAAQYIALLHNRYFSWSTM